MDKTQIAVEQMHLLQSRIEAYTARLWQLPFTYLGVFAVTVGFIDDGIGVRSAHIFWALSLVGVIVGLCMWGAADGYKRATRHLVQMENEIGYRVVTQFKTIQTFPYFLLVLMVAAGSVYLGLAVEDVP